MQDNRPIQLTDSFLARQLARHRPEVASETITPEQRENRRLIAQEVEELISRLRGNPDFEQYMEWVRLMVEEKRRTLMKPELPDSEVPRAKANYLTAVDFANLLTDQEITARRILDPNDPRIGELAVLKFT